jgi:hypothetical protein
MKFLFRPKPPPPPPDCVAIRRMQNRWETGVIQRDVSRTGPTRDRWGTSNDAQIPISDTNGSTTSSQGK